ncbi:hypothetical protein OH77DRAFT_73374 [Trametes cingulata]|nr:hypothetical protein OH77DRAFT_73374 [Trametes cingulata]
MYRDAQSAGRTSSILPLVVCALRVVITPSLASGSFLATMSIFKVTLCTIEECFFPAARSLSGTLHWTVQSPDRRAGAENALTARLV